MSAAELKDRIELLKSKPILDAKETALLTGYSVRAVVRLCANGTIQAVKVAGSWRINTAALLDQFGIA